MTPLAKAYYDHHFKCPRCIAAGLGTNYGARCVQGLKLWQAYQKPQPIEPKGNRK